MLVSKRDNSRFKGLNRHYPLEHTIHLSKNSKQRKEKKSNWSSQHLENIWDVGGAAGHPVLAGLKLALE